MNLKRKILRLVDLRVRHYWAGEHSSTLTSHPSPNDTGTLKSDSVEFKAYPVPDKMTVAS